jgi:hypothetical protein
MTAEEGPTAWCHGANGAIVRLADLADPRPAREAPDASAECSQGSWLPRALSPDTHVPARHVVADGCSKVD